MTVGYPVIQHTGAITHHVQVVRESVTEIAQGRRVQLAVFVVQKESVGMPVP